jgi:hypothetical protein
MLSERLEKDETLAGTSVDAERFSDTDLMERQASYGRTGFMLQFMLDTSMSDMEKYPLRLRDLIVMSCDREAAPQKTVWSNDSACLRSELPCVGLLNDKYYGPRTLIGEWLPYTASVMAIDPSGRGADETSYAVGKLLNSQIFLLEAGGFYGDGYSQQVLESLVEIAGRNSVNEVLIESNFGDGMFRSLIEPYFLRAGYPVTIEEVRSRTQKEKRIIDTLEPVMNQHRLIVDSSLIERDFEETNASLPLDKALKYQLMYQLSHVTRERNSLGHDDRLDALAMLAGRFVELMNADADVKIRQHKEELLNRELAVFMGNLSESKSGLVALLGREPRNGQQAGVSRADTDARHFL